jgi:1-acyl-sn-glycerol-3-phosphate acyltransferase
VNTDSSSIQSGQAVSEQPGSFFDLIRTLWSLSLIGILCVFWMSVAIIATLFARNRDVSLMLGRRFWGPQVLRAGGVRLQVEPLPNVDWSKPHIYAMNHQSQFDIPCAFVAIPANVRFVAKHTLKYIPFLGWYMIRSGMIFINRKNRASAMASLKEAGEKIRQGSNILVYPEGTRSKDGLMLSFKKGPFMVASEAKVPIIPVAIEGTWKIMPSGTARIRPGTVRMKFGQPIATDNLPQRGGRDALLVQVRHELLRLQKELGGKGGVDQDIAAAGKEGAA